MPWMVYVSYTFQRNGQAQFSLFTGSLISPRYVLTCGHCGGSVNRMTENDTMIVVYGSANKNGGHRIVLNKTAAIQAIHRHPNYTETGGGPIFRDQGILDVGY
jgi:secreted trypsin-like serine protease